MLRRVNQIRLQLFQVLAQQIQHARLFNLQVEAGFFLDLNVKLRTNAISLILFHLFLMKSEVNLRRRLAKP